MFRTLLAAALVAGPAAAAPALFTSKAAFLAAAPATTLETFNDGVPGFIDAARRFGPLTIGSTGVYPNSIGPGSASFSIDGSNFVVITVAIDSRSTSGESGFRFTFDRPVTAFGGDFGVLSARGEGTGFSIDGFTIALLPQGSDGTGFFGVVDSNPFTTFKLLNVEPNADFPIDDFAFDNARYQFAASVPEPATWALLIVGFGAVGAAARRRRSVAA